jgi:hypothetical protein
MGGTQSSSISSVLNQTAISVISKDIMQCVSTATQNQLIGAGFVAGNVDISNVSLTQGSSINTSCVLQASTQNTITADLGTALANAASTTGQAGIPTFGTNAAQTASNITNQLNLNIANTNLTQDFNNATQNQNIEFGVVEGNFVMKNVSLSQTAAIASQNLLNTTAYSQVMGSVINQAQQSASSTSENPIAGIFSAMGNAFAGVTTPIAIAVACVALLLIAAAIWWFFIRKH